MYIANIAALNSSFPGMLNYDTASSEGMTTVGYLTAAVIFYISCSIFIIPFFTLPDR